MTAVRSGHFDGLHHIADIGGGSGAFAIPLALDYRDLRITLLELPRALPYIKPFLERYAVQDRVELVGFNVHETPWPLAGCDGLLFGNMLHFCDDAECLVWLRESRRLLSEGGRVFLHEMLWDDEHDGPLLTALWNFWMATISGGRQRTAREIGALLDQAGFRMRTVEPTAGGFSLIVGVARGGA